MKICFIYPAFERHAQAHPELRGAVPANEYIGPPSLGIASVAAQTPAGHELQFVDDRITPFNPNHDADLFALSFFTPAATRGLEIAKQLRARGKKVVLGGIFPSRMPEECARHADAVVVGEGEGIWPQVVEDASNGDLRPRYDGGYDLDLSSIARPKVELYLDNESKEFAPDDYPLQISRGCPLKCDACVLPAMHGPKIRFHSEKNLFATMRALAERGKFISLTEDTSSFGMGGARKFFRKFLEGTVELREESGLNLKLSYVGISMPMILNLDETLLELLRKTGIARFYLVGGFDPITRKAFGTGDPAAMEKAERCIQRCHDFDIDPYVSFLVGNRDDDEGTFDRMLEFSRRTRVDLAEFVVSTPYPGTPLWQEYNAGERIFDFQWKHYNDANVVFHPHKMSAERLQEGYLYLWREFYRGRKEELEARDHERRTIQF